MINTHRRSTVVNVTREHVFDWHARPGAFERLAPPWSPTRVTARTGRPLEPGSRVDLRVKVGPFWNRWLAEHGEWEPGVMFSDYQVVGPFRSWGTPIGLTMRGRRHVLRTSFATRSRSACLVDSVRDTRGTRSNGCSRIGIGSQPPIFTFTSTSEERPCTY